MMSYNTSDIIPVAGHVKVLFPHNITATDGMADGMNGTVPDGDPESVAVKVLRAIPMLMIMLGAILGNILVITSVLKFRRLRAKANAFICSLAFADLLVALFVMPFNFSQELLKKWVFGEILCDIYNSNDVLFSTASLLHLGAISIDRYIAILDPFHYEEKVTRLTIGIMLSIVWGLSAMISYIPITVTQVYIKDGRAHAHACDPTSGQCLCEFVVNPLYAVISSMVSFWVPAIIMIFAYVKIFKAARRQEKQIHALQQTARASLSMDNISNTSGNNLHSSHQSINNGGSGIHTDLRSERRRIKREHKAAKTLGVIMGGFMICWLPFFLWYLVSNICGDSCPIYDMVVSVLFWIGYFNSALNPIIYAYFNREFRNAFKKILRWNKCPCNRHDMNGQMTYASEFRNSLSGENTQTYTRTKRSAIMHLNPNGNAHHRGSS